MASVYMRVSWLSASQKGEKAATSVAKSAARAPASLCASTATSATPATPAQTLKARANQAMVAGASAMVMDVMRSHMCNR